MTKPKQRKKPRGFYRRSLSLSIVRSLEQYLPISDQRYDQTVVLGVHTSMILHKARIAFALYRTSLPIDVSFIILLVTMITSSAVLASSFIIKYTICRKEASLFWKSFEMPKKRDVASLVGNFSPVKRRRAIFVRSIRHRRGDIGDELKRRAMLVLSSAQIDCKHSHLLGRQRSCQPLQSPDQHPHPFCYNAL